MHEKVRIFLEDRRKKAEEARKQAKNRYLINLGLYEREYNEGGFSNEYTEYDAETAKYFRRNAIQVSDEDYAELCSLTEEEAAQNSIALVLTVLGWVAIIGGFFIGIVLGAVSNTGYERDFLGHDLSIVGAGLCNRDKFSRVCGNYKAASCAGSEPEASEIIP